MMAARAGRSAGIRVRRKRERPVREAEALKSIDTAHISGGVSGGEQPRVRDRVMPEHLLAAEVSDATSNCETLGFQISDRQSSHKLLLPQHFLPKQV